MQKSIALTLALGVLLVGVVGSVAAESASPPDEPPISSDRHNESDAGAENFTVSGSVVHSNGSAATGDFVSVYSIEDDHNYYTYIREDGTFETEVPVGDQYIVAFVDTYVENGSSYFDRSPNQVPDTYTITNVSGPSNVSVGEVTIPTAYRLNVTAYGGNVDDLSEAGLTDEQLEYSVFHLSPTADYYYGFMNISSEEFDLRFNSSDTDGIDVVGDVEIYAQTQTNDSVVFRPDELTDPATLTVDSNTSTSIPLDKLYLPQPVISASETTVNVGANVTFNSFESSDRDGQIESIEWDLDEDGKVDASGDTATSTFSEVGTHNVTLNVTDDDGLSNTTTKTITVKASSDAPPAVGTFENQPTDPDGDGVYEDVNGDGQVSITDVQALFANTDDSAVQNNPSQFDINGDGKASITDVQALFVEVTG